MSSDYASNVTWQDICSARNRISPHLHRTPLLTCSTVDRMAGGGTRVGFKKCLHEK